MLNSQEQQEILRRRTFAIISHPDAGKTTLTEKLLLYGGAIHVAGAVKSNKIRKTATSDWMEIEKQRGISVATSVMGFDYNNYHFYWWFRYFNFIYGFTFCSWQYRPRFWKNRSNG